MVLAADAAQYLRFNIEARRDSKDFVFSLNPAQHTTERWNVTFREIAYVCKLETVLGGDVDESMPRVGEVGSSASRA
jgi:hypothetical protein